MGSPRLVHLSNVLPPASDEKMTGQQGGSAAERDAPAIAEHFPQKTHQQGKNARSGGEKHAVQGVDARAESFGDVALDGGASQNGAVAAEKAADGAVDQHQRIGQPEQAHVHNHIIFCAVDFAEHKKYISNRKSYAQIRRVSDRLCRENGLSVVAPGAERGKQYAEWDAQRKGTSYKQKLKIAIDRLIPISKDLDDLLRRLEAEGYEIKRGKYISFRAPGQERFTRAKTLGEAYTEEAIAERIKGKVILKTPKPERSGVSLLIDIENCIKAQQSAGYERWAKIENLKRAARTMVFLDQHGISRYTDLEQKITELQDSNEQTAAALKTAERRLSDLALLIKHTATYKELKPLYSEYKKSRDKEKYLRGREREIILFEASARALKAAGVGDKLPDLAKLREEYSRLTEEKDRLYAEYGSLKKRMQEYDAVKQNIDSILSPNRGQEQDKAL